MGPRVKPEDDRGVVEDDRGVVEDGRGVVEDGRAVVDDGGSKTAFESVGSRDCALGRLPQCTTAKNHLHCPRTRMKRRPIPLALMGRYQRLYVVLMIILDPDHDSSRP